MRLENPGRGGNSDSRSLIKSDPPKGKAFRRPPEITSDRKRNGKESGKVGLAGKGKRESEEPGKRNCTARFDRESDTKES
ncbi:hypothetical protein, partial [Streptomyces griseus]|uniref:hypothetical protein n=1 Tax=Streptomyces griseus TaxID=1911 RepID=UPI001F4714EF